ncbi:hypothetical protein Slin15195_G001640 [Septoria linicola]|uniref:Uncharacterized protein n=1 Tax=Septoria linicola TaxID=215465 RepID=A0A9Q9EDI9_9PEZI|nr:hypothetical protein Slin14017_G001670 [Septoria linicola]USW46845.1 hypothetical protein Slin15195_G001640 [Septoria linicola]
MDSITHLTNKMLAERARQQQLLTPLETAPPPYSAAEDDSDSEDEDDEPALPIKLTINAAHNIQGCNNLVPTSPSPLADATKFGTILLQAVNQINAANAAAVCNGAGSPKPRRPLKVDLTINCGVTVVGDRNVIGNVGLKPRSPTATSPACSAAIAGAKRKAEDTPVEDSEPVTKKVATGEE